MLPFIIRRILISIPLILLASFLVFVMVANSGDPLSELRVNPRVSPAEISLRENELNLDEPVITRYVEWLGNVVTGDFGVDKQGNEVWPQLWRALQVTLRLVTFALVLAVFLALVVGVIGALRQYSWFDYGTTFLSFLFFSLPIFWLAALLKEYVAGELNDLAGTQWVYTIGESTPSFDGNYWERMWDYFGHTILPALTLIVISVAAYSRFVRSSMLDTLSSDYVRTAKAKGLPRRKVITNHALRNALIPVTTVVAIDFGAILGGAIVTERVFAWNGMGTLLIDGIKNIDPNVVQAWLLVTAVVVVLFNLLADVAYAWLDPRIRLD